MNKQKVQTMLNVEILNRMPDKAASSVLKNIIFNPKNKINWDEAYQLMMSLMPELSCYDGYRTENMQ